MHARFLKAQDTISGQEGRAYATINSRVHEMFYIKTLEASVERIRRRCGPLAAVECSTKRRAGLDPAP